MQRRVDPAVAVRRRDDVEPVGCEAALEEVDDPRLILDHEDQRAHPDLPHLQAKSILIVR